jgi:glucan biosynthesis protein C
MLIPFHTARIFDDWPFYVKSVESIPGLIEFIKIVNQWHMHLFFLLAGASSYFALKFRSRKEFVIERIKRLFIPLLFGVAVIIPPQSYLRLFDDVRKVWPEWAAQYFIGGPDYQKSFFAFYTDYFNGPFPEGNFEWGHLWFLAYLFVFP